MSELATTGSRNAILEVEAHQARIQIIQRVMRQVMKNGAHYGPAFAGSDKPTLYKAGAEVIMATFRICPEIEVEEIPDAGGHVRYRVKVKALSADGEFLGEGVGEGSTGEDKYAWEGAACSAQWESLPESRRRIKWKRNGDQIQQVATNPADKANCVTPDTLILTHDLQWVRAGDIETGDQLVGVEEQMTSEYARHLAVGEATVHGRRVDDLYKLTFEDGRSVRCNGEHQWLVKKIGLKGTQWVATQEICDEFSKPKGRPRKWTVISLCSPWDEDSSKEAGYLAGLFDADGSLGVNQIIASFAQQDNVVLALMKRGLEARGYTVGINPQKSPEALARTNLGKQVYQMRVRGGIIEQMRLIGSIRPPRLLDRWVNLVDLEKKRLEGRGSGSGKPVRIVSVEPIGRGEVVMLGTTCRTYIAEGLVCHNTVLKMAKKRALVDMVLTVTAASDVFSQDLDEDAEPEAGRPVIKQPQAKKSQPAGQRTQSQPQQQNAAPQSAPSSDGRLREVGAISKVFTKEFTNDKGGYTRWGVLVNDQWHNTFDEELGGHCEAAYDAQETVAIEYEVDQYGRKIIAVDTID